MKKCFLVMILSLLLFGCGSSDYERDDSLGQAIKINLSQMVQMMENKEEFVISFETDLCNYCQAFDEVYEQYRANHHVDLYKVMLSDEKTSEDANRALINKYFPTFSTTPGVYYARDGKVVSSLTDNARSVDWDDLDAWVQKYQIDRKK